MLVIDVVLEVFLSHPSFSMFVLHHLRIHKFMSRMFLFGLCLESLDLPPYVKVLCVFVHSARSKLNAQWHVKQETYGSYQMLSYSKFQ